MEASANTYEDCNALSRVTLRDTWPPAWLVPRDKATAEPVTEPVTEPDVATPEINDEPSSLAWEAAQSPQEADASLAAALAEFEPVRFELLLTSEQARERLAAMVAEADEWIERVGADGRRGWDRPGQLVNTRWWETTSLDDLPTWCEAHVLNTRKPEQLLPKTRRKSSSRKLHLNRTVGRGTDESISLTSPTQGNLGF